MRRRRRKEDLEKSEEEEDIAEDNEFNNKVVLPTLCAVSMFKNILNTY